MQDYCDECTHALFTPGANLNLGLAPACYRQVQVQLKIWLRGPEVGRAIPCKNWRWDAGGTEVGRRWDQKWYQILEVGRLPRLA